MSLYSFISLLYKQLLQYTLLKFFTVPSAVLTQLPKKFHTKLLASAFIFTKFSTKTLCFDAAVFNLSIKGYCKTRPHRSYCFLSMLKLRCKRHYRNLATYIWCTTWREHVTKTAPARRRHSVGGGGGAAAARRRRRTALVQSTSTESQWCTMQLVLSSWWSEMELLYSFRMEHRCLNMILILCCCMLRWSA